VVSRHWSVLQPNDAPAVKTDIDAADMTLPLVAGMVVEDRVQIVNPTDRPHVAIIVPLAAGLEPLNPSLATAPPEATPSQPTTLNPTYTSWRDDHVAYYFNQLPKGTWDLSFRARATTPGRFTQPPAYAEMMYDTTVYGASPGATVQITRAAE